MIELIFLLLILRKSVMFHFERLPTSLTVPFVVTVFCLPTETTAQPSHHNDIYFAYLSTLQLFRNPDLKNLSSLIQTLHAQ
jgi:hypothetical protein